MDTGVNITMQKTVGIVNVIHNKTFSNIKLLYKVSDVPKKDLTLSI